MSSNQETLKQEPEQREQWERTFAPCRPMVIGIALRRGLTREDAEDFAQDVLLKSFRYVGRILHLPAVCKFVARVAATSLVDRFRTTRGRSELTGVLNRAEEDGGDWFDRADLQSVFGAAVIDPEAVVQQQDRMDRMMVALKQLPDRDRTILILHHLQEHPFEEIAKIMGISRDAAKMTASRARKRLKEILKDDEIG